MKVHHLPSCMNVSFHSPPDIRGIYPWTLEVFRMNLQSCQEVATVSPPVFCVLEKAPSKPSGVLRRRRFTSVSCVFLSFSHGTNLIFQKRSMRKFFSPKKQVPGIKTGSKIWWSHEMTLLTWLFGAGGGFGCKETWSCSPFLTWRSTFRQVNLLFFFKGHFISLCVSPTCLIKDSFLSKPETKKITQCAPFFQATWNHQIHSDVAGLSQLVKWTALAAFGLCLRRNPTLLHLGWLKWRCLENFDWNFCWCKACFGACYLWEDAWRNMIQMVEKKKYSRCVSSYFFWRDL